MLAVNNATFSTLVIEESKSRPVVVEFGASWCGPCQTLKKVIASIEPTRPDVRFAEVDIDTAPALANQYQIRGVPRVMVFSGGVCISDRFGSIQANTLLAMIQKKVGA